MADYRCEKCGDYRVFSKNANGYLCKKCHDGIIDNGKTIISSVGNRADYFEIFNKALFGEDHGIKNN